jgi:hypothetical protein
MAKDAKKAGAKKGAEKKAIGRTAQDEGFKYGVNELADELGVEPASARVALRKHGIEKQGAVYGWKNDRDFDAVIKQIKGDAKKAAKKDDKKSSKNKAKDEGGRGRSRKDEPRDEGEEAGAE